MKQIASHRDYQAPVSETEELDFDAPGDKRGLWKPALLIAVVLLALILAKVLGLDAHLKEIEPWIASLGHWGPLVFVAIYVVATLAAMLHAGGGRVTDVERETEHGRAVWDIEVQRGGVEHDIDVDRATGDVLRHRSEADDDNRKGRDDDSKGRDDDHDDHDDRHDDDHGYDD